MHIHTLHTLNRVIQSLMWPTTKNREEQH